MKPRPAEQLMRTEVVSRVQEVIKRLWPSAEVCTFVFYQNELVTKTSK